MKSSRVTRREFIGSLAAAGVLAGTGSGRAAPNRIDRFALVSRHNPILRRFEPLSPLSVGNGEFAFTCDVTGLQTFPDLYKDAMPLCTMSQWGWHTNPLPASLKGKTFKPTEYDSYGRKVPYITGKSGQEELYDYLRENPHRLHLGQVGFRLVKANGDMATPADITNIEQRLNLWTGTINSRFRFQGDDVSVQTSTQSPVPVGAYWIFTDAIPRSEVAVALSATALVSGEPGLLRLTTTVLKSAAVVIEAVEYELAVKSAPDAPAFPPTASARSPTAARRENAAPDAMRPARRTGALRVPVLAIRGRFPAAATRR